MWWTPDGERILQDAEATRFREALGTLVDMVRDDDDGMWQFNALPFDDLQPNQKLAVLAQSGTALLREDQRLTAGYSGGCSLLAIGRTGAYPGFGHVPGHPVLP